jgi:hypothetical protein
LLLDDARRRAFEPQVGTPGFHGQIAMNMTSYEKGFAKGFAQGMEMGRQRARRDILREILEERFGPLAPEALRRLDELPVDQLLPLRKAAWKAASLAELGLDR